MFRNKVKLGIAGVILASGLSVALSSVSGAAQAFSNVTTNSPTGTADQTAATLNGVINPNGLDTTYYFVYGGPGNLNYPTETAVVDAGSGTSPVNVTASLTGLVPNSAYTVELVATSAAGFVAGNTVTFTTNWPVAKTNGYSALNLNSATLTGSVNPNGIASSYFIEFGTTLAYGTNTAVVSAGSGIVPVSASVNVGGLTAGLTYNYQLVATNSFGTTYGGNQTFVPSGLPLLGSTQVVTTTDLKLRKTAVHFGKETQERVNVTVQAVGYSPTGSVTMTAGNQTLCTTTIVLNHAACVLHARSLKVGRYAIKASFTGNTPFIASASNGLALRVLK